MVGRCRLLLRTFFSALVSLVAHQSPIRIVTARVLSFRSRPALAFQNCDLWIHCAGFAVFHMVHYDLGRSRLRADDHRSYCRHRRLVGGVESPHRRLIFGLFGGRITVNCSLACVLINVWYDAVNDESHRTKSKPKGHLPCTDKVAEIRFIDIR